ncbi:hypothetical protein C8Q78DRAFT_989228 [Trametes maxima]|nr:hypothetical protein C8Q78DRAFT_989228 [Trametes maxima]
MPIKLTPLSCERLRCPDDKAILTENPIIRILVLQETTKQADGTDGHKAFATDGATYTHILISPSVSALIGDNDTQVHVGSAVRLTRIARLPRNSRTGCPVIVDGMEVEYLAEDYLPSDAYVSSSPNSDNLSGEPGLEPDSPPMMVKPLPGPLAPGAISRSMSCATDVSMATDTTMSSNGFELNYPVDTIAGGFEVLQQRNMQLVVQYNNEHRRRRLLEHVLATVCRDLVPGEARPSIAFSEAMMRMADLVAQAGGGFNNGIDA